ncbi:MAG: hypothetical protein K2O65_05600 [Lachnospiraceae bacterium]|nr:hypothetical protein [Lachnospiraceae bacterium]
MPYRIMQNLIQNGTRSKESLSEMADVFFAVGRLSEKQYMEITEKINRKGVNN